MNTRLLAVFAALLGLLYSGTVHAQGTCGTPAPPSEWDVWFNKQVEEYIKARQQGKSQIVSHTIPVVVHVIHYNDAYGTYPNIDSNQIKSQIDVLNKDFNANGLNLGTCPPHFTANIANTGIKFCRALIHGKTNAILTEPGVDRVNAVAFTWQNPNTPTLNLQQYMNSTIIPATIWDPTKYLNIWISDRPATETKNGWATYPSGTGVLGLFNGSFGTSTNDGIWVWAKAFGTVGTLVAPWNKGRTAVHELGHWLGLRHIWGDGNCQSDYCHDTPDQKGPHTTCPTGIVEVDQCGVNTAPFGSMYMNFMDMTEDQCRYMFTNQQNLRMQAAMSQCSQRNQLGSHGLCTPTNVPASTSSAVANFEMGTDLCTNSPVTPYNNSSGYPNPTFLWKTIPAAQFYPSPTVASPQITFNNPGTYTVEVTATNSLSSSTKTLLVNATGTCIPFNVCLDSIRMIKAPDTLKSYAAPNSSLFTKCQSGFAGFLAGTNCYNDKEFAQFFPPTSYTGIPSPQVNSVLILFDKSGTKTTGGTTPISCKIYGGSAATGPSGMIGNATTVFLNNITGTTPTTNVNYLAKSGYVFPGGIIPYMFNLTKPIVVNSNSGFYVAITAPYTVPPDSIRIITNTIHNTAVDSTAWLMQNPGNTWRTFRYYRGMKVQLAMMPFITCSPVAGLSESANEFARSINVMPNPGDGLFNLVFTLPREERINIRIFNAMGQQISNDELENVSSQVFQVDLTGKPDGVYFTEISSPTGKVVRKLILQR